MASVVKTRNIASTNLIQVKQSNLIAFIKACGPDYESDAPAQAFNPANRLTVINVEYYAENTDDGVVLVPNCINWTYQQDMATQADKIALSKLETTIKPIKTLLDMGEITKEQFDNMTCALVDLGEFERLRSICADGASETKYASASIHHIISYGELVESVVDFVAGQK